MGAPKHITDLGAMRGLGVKNHDLIPLSAEAAKDQQWLARKLSMNFECSRWRLPQKPFSATVAAGPDWRVDFSPTELDYSTLAMAAAITLTVWEARHLPIRTLFVMSVLFSIGTEGANL